jgi:phage I-like protein
MPKRAQGIPEAAVGGKRYPLNMRTTKETRDKLMLAASESGRSLTQEVEWRLERSFDDRRDIEILFSGAVGQSMLDIAQAVRLVEAVTEKLTGFDAVTTRAVAVAIESMAKQPRFLSPPLSTAAMSENDKATAQMLGERVAEMVQERDIAELKRWIASQPPAEAGGNMLARAGTPAETVDECVDR